jgi:hypothetical protein
LSKTCISAAYAPVETGGAVVVVVVGSAVVVVVGGAAVVVVVAVVVGAAVVVVFGGAVVNCAEAVFSLSISLASAGPTKVSVCLSSTHKPQPANNINKETTAAIAAILNKNKLDFVLIIRKLQIPIIKNNNGTCRLMSINTED